MTLARRALLVALSLLLVATVARQTISLALAKTDPELALQFSRDQPPALGLAAWKRATKDGGTSSEDYALAKAQALRALELDPTSVSAVEALAAIADQTGNSAFAARAMMLSDKLTRRSLPTRLWLAENAVRRGDVAGALDNYDIALRTSGAARELLFPILNDAVADPNILSGLARVLDRQPEWAGVFMYTAITSGKNTRPMGALLDALKHPPTYDGKDLRQVLVETLLAEQDVASARMFARGLPRSSQNQLTIIDPTFSSDGGPTPLNWQLNDDSDVGAARSSEGLKAESRSLQGGIAALQSLALSPGRYIFSSHTRRPAAPSGLPPYWTIDCLVNGGATIATVQLNSTNVTALVEVPAGCTVQRLQLHLPSNTGDSPTAYTIIDVRLQRR